jgi:hypothetical protein
MAMEAHSSRATPAHIALILAAVLWVSYRIYRWLLPKPIPGIPHNQRATRTLLGDSPDVTKFLRAGGYFRQWLVNQTIEHNSPLVQLWILPFAKPSLVLCDFREAQDVLVRRNKEFDRSKRWLDLFSTLTPDHHIAMSTMDDRFRGNKELVRDLMSPAFLHNVSVFVHSKVWSSKFNPQDSGFSN